MPADRDCSCQGHRPLILSLRRYLEQVWTNVITAGTPTLTDLGVTATFEVVGSHQRHSTETAMPGS